MAELLHNLSFIMKMILDHIALAVPLIREYSDLISCTFKCEKKIYLQLKSHYIKLIITISYAVIIGILEESLRKQHKKVGILQV